MGVEGRVKSDRERAMANAGSELAAQLFPQAEAGTMDSEILRIAITSQKDILRETLKQWDRLQSEKPMVFTDARRQRLGELLAGQ